MFKRFEVVVIEFDFRAVEDFVSHGQEEVFELAGDLGDRMQAAAVGRGSGGSVASKSSARRAAVELARSRECRRTRSAIAFEDRLLEGVGLLAVCLAVFGSKFRDLGEHCRDESLLADEFALQILECLCVFARAYTLARSVERGFRVHLRFLSFSDTGVALPRWPCRSKRVTP